MTEIKVKMLGVLNKSSKQDMILKFSGESDIEQVLKKLADEEIFTLSSTFSNMEEVLQNNLILINGIEVRNLDGIRTKIEDGDSLILIPVTHGG